MKIKDNKIIEASEAELFELYLKREIDDIMSFPDYKERMIRAGVKIIKE